MKKAVLLIICILSCVFALYYHGINQDTPSASTYNGFALMFAAEALLSFISLILHWTGAQGKWVKRCFTWTYVLGFLVLLTAIVLGMNFVHEGFTLPQ